MEQNGTGTDCLFILNLIPKLRSVSGIHFPQTIEDDLNAILPSLVQLARLLYEKGYVIGILERISTRFLDLHCYTNDEAEYEEYWSAVEQSLTQSDWDELLADEADLDISD